MRIKTLLAVVLSVILAYGLLVLPASARDRGGSPVTTGALVGAGIGAAVGGLSSEAPNRTGAIVKGALIGGGAGAAIGYLGRDRYDSDRRHWKHRKHRKYYRRGW